MKTPIFLLVSFCFLLISSCENPRTVTNGKKNTGGEAKDYYFENTTLIRTDSNASNRIFLDFYLGMSKNDVDGHLKALRNKKVVHTLTGTSRNLDYFFLRTSSGDSIRAYFHFNERDFYNDTLFTASIQADSYTHIGFTLFFSKEGSTPDERNKVGDLFVFFIAKYPELRDVSNELKLPFRVISNDMKVAYESVDKSKFLYGQVPGSKFGYRNLDGSIETSSPYATVRTEPLREQITYSLTSISNRKENEEKQRRDKKNKANRMKFKKSVDDL